MKRFYLLLLLFLAGCGILPAGINAAGSRGAAGGGQVASPSAQPSLSATDCGCTIGATPTGGLLLPAPAGPIADTPTPAPLESLRDHWETYTNVDFNFSFQYPAAYTSGKYAFCAARPNPNKLQDTLLEVDLGSRTTLTLRKAPAMNIAALADAYQKDPSHQSLTFDPPKPRTVGGVPAVTLPYRSGGVGRYSEVTFFIQGDTLYTIESGMPSACDIPTLELNELAAYSHVLDSFNFTQ